MILIETTDQLKRQVQSGFQNKQLSTDDLESLRELIQKLVEPVKAKKQKELAWKQFWHELEIKCAYYPKNFKVCDNLPLISFLRENYQEWDIRKWSGYLVEG